MALLLRTFDERFSAVHTTGNLFPKHRRACHVDDMLDATVRYWEAEDCEGVA